MMILRNSNGFDPIFWVFGQTNFLKGIFATNSTFLLWLEFGRLWTQDAQFNSEHQLKGCSTAQKLLEWFPFDLKWLKPLGKVFEWSFLTISRFKNWRFHRSKSSAPWRYRIVSNKTSFKTSYIMALIFGHKTG